jgi:hypothetical protein
MKRMGLLLAVVLLAAATLSGCVIVPLGGWYGGGWEHPHSSPHPYYYRGR